MPSEGAYSRDLQIRSVGTAFLRLRPLIVAPLMVLALAVLWRAEIPSAQLRILALGFSAMLAFFTAEAFIGRRRLFGAAALWRSLALTLAGIGFGSWASGGLESPLFVLAFAPVGVGFAAFGRTRRADALLVLLGTIAGGFLLAAPWQPFPPLPRDAHRLLGAGAVITGLLLLRVGVASLTDAHARSAEAFAGVAGELAAATRARREALADLGAKVAHEVKNPLAAIRALIEVTLEGAAPKVEKRLRVAAGEVARIEQILADYLSASRPLGELARRDVSVKALLERVALLMEAKLSGRSLRLSVEVEDPALTWALDPDRTQEALLNLVLNAAEATPPGGRVMLRQRRAPGALVLEVEDEGRGLPPEVIARLETEPPASTRPGGSGLGLSLAREVAARQGGRMELESEPGRGTRARFWVPASGGREASS